MGPGTCPDPVYLFPYRLATDGDALVTSLLHELNDVTGVNRVAQFGIAVVHLDGEIVVAFRNLENALEAFIDVQDGLAGQVIVLVPVLPGDAFDSDHAVTPFDLFVKETFNHQPILLYHNNQSYG